MQLGPYLLGPNDTPENGIYTGDAKELAKLIPDEGVDLIFTDPVYQNLDDCRWLAETAARILKDNSACLAFCGIEWLDVTMLALGSALTYAWLVPWIVPGSSSYCRLGPSRFMCMLWYEKGASRIYRRCYDTMFPSKKGSGHRWAKNPAGTRFLTEAFSRPSDIVIDFFCGGGIVPAVCKMLGRNYLAFEIGPDIAEQARNRVRNTQPPLFVLEPEQITLFQDNDNAM